MHKKILALLILLRLLPSICLASEKDTNLVLELQISPSNINVIIPENMVDRITQGLMKHYNHEIPTKIAITAICSVLSIKAGFTCIESLYNLNVKNKTENLSKKDFIFPIGMGLISAGLLGAIIFINK